MTYPASADVSAGQPTAVDHYNNLRADALRFGAPAADGANIASIFKQYESNLTITILSTDRLRIPCTSTDPVGIIIDGIPLYSENNIDLPTLGKPSGAAAPWYVFAIRSAGSTTFTLEVNTSAAEAAFHRLIGSFYWNGTAIEEYSIRTHLADYLKSLLKITEFAGCDGRLFVRDTPDFSDTSTGTFLALLPYKGNRISFYTAGFGWNSYPIQIGASPPQIAFSSLNSAKCYDAFAYWNGSAVALEYLAWTDTLSRATSLTYLDGVYLKSSNLSRLYLGSFIPYDATTVYDSKVERGLWNYFNRVERYFEKLIATSSWTYNVASWRAPNGSEAFVRLCNGIAAEVCTFDLVVPVLPAASVYPLVGVGILSTSTNSAEMIAGGGNGTVRHVAHARLRRLLPIGAYNIHWLESISGAGTVTFYGATNGSIASLSGIMAM